MRSPRFDELLIIIGSMKSGTTTLFNLLNAHPSIAGSAEKEPQFFANPDVFAKGEAWYFDLWPSISKGQIALEASTDYTKYPYAGGVTEKLHTFLTKHHIKPHFVYIMRDPIERAQSHLKHLYFVGKDTINRPQSFGSLDVGIPTRCLAYSSYAMQLDQFRRTFPDASMTLLTMEKLKSDPLGTANIVFKALGLHDLAVHDLPQRTAYNDAASIEEWNFLPGFYSALTDNVLFRTLITPLFTPERRQALRKLIARKPKYPRHVFNQDEVIYFAKMLEADLIRLKLEYGIDPKASWPKTTRHL